MYFYPLVVIAFVGYMSAQKIREKWQMRSKLAQMPLDLAKELKRQDNFPLS